MDGQYYEAIGTEDGFAVWKSSGNYPEIVIDPGGGLPTARMGGAYGTYNDLDLLFMGVIKPTEAYTASDNTFRWIEPRLTAPLAFHCGIFVGFSPTDLVYFGFYQDHRKLVAQRTGRAASAPTPLGPDYRALSADANGIALRVVRRGSKYYFQARHDASAGTPTPDIFDDLDAVSDPDPTATLKRFRTVAVITEDKPPGAIGVITRAWNPHLAEIEVKDLELLYKTSVPTSPDEPLPETVRKNFKTDTLPGLVELGDTYDALPFGKLFTHIPATGAQVKVVGEKLRIMVPFTALLPGRVPYFPKPAYDHWTGVDNAPKVLTKAPSGDFAFGTVASMHRSMLMPRAGGNSIGTTVWGTLKSRKVSTVSLASPARLVRQQVPPPENTYKVAFILAADDRASISDDVIQTADAVRRYWDATFHAATKGRRYSDSRLAAPFSGWAEVPHGGKTRSGPAATMGHSGETEQMHLFVRALDDSVYAKVFAKGSWGAWYLVPPELKTSARPAATVFETGFGEVVYVFATRLDGRIFFNTNWKGGGWAGWQEVPGGGTQSTQVSEWRAFQ